MKSVILNLQEDLTDEQIDQLIVKLKNSKKVKVVEKPAPKITFTKQEKRIFENIEKLTNTGKGYFSTTAHQYDDLEAFRKGVIDYMKEELISNQQYQEVEIRREKKVIKDLQEDIKTWEKYVRDISKTLKEVDVLDKLLKNKIAKMNGQ